MLSIASALLIILLAVGEKFNPLHLTSEEKVLSLFFPIGVIAGFAISWFWEGMGGLITILSLCAFYLSNYLCYDSLPKGIAFFVFASPGFLFAIDGLIRMVRREKQDDQSAKNIHVAS